MKYLLTMGVFDDWMKIKNYSKDNILSKKFFLYRIHDFGKRNKKNKAIISKTPCFNS